MTSLYDIPFPIVETVVMPFLSNKDIFTMIKTCTMYRNQINSQIIDDISSIYVVGVIPSDQQLTKSLFLFRNITNVCKSIQEYYVARSHIDFYQSNNYKQYKFHIHKIKFGSTFHITQEIQTLYSYDDLISADIKQIYPTLIGSIGKIYCNSMKTLDKFVQIVYIFTPSKINTTKLFANSIKQFGVKHITSQTTRDRVCTRYFFY